jgi:hypothetical protein
MKTRIETYAHPGIQGSIVQHALQQSQSWCVKACIQQCRAEADAPCLDLAQMESASLGLQWDSGAPEP